MNENKFGFLDSKDIKTIEIMEKMLEDKYNKNKESPDRKTVDNKTA